MIDLNFMSKTACIIAKARGQTGNVFKHMAGEVIEAQEALYSEPDELANELADVIICCLSAAGHYGLNIEKAIEYKMEQNVKRIPK